LGALTMTAEFFKDIHPSEPFRSRTAEDSFGSED
jgi:hypothetical protein